MSNLKTKLKLIVCILSTLGANHIHCFADTEPPPNIDMTIDHKRYITLDEIGSGDRAYALTVLKDREIEKIDMYVLNVVRNFRPGRDAILVS